MTEAEARETNMGKLTFSPLIYEMSIALIAEGESKGFCQGHCNEVDWQRFSASTLCSPAAGEVIHEFVLAMKEGIPLRKLSSVIHVYPTFSSIVWRVAGKWLAEGKLIQTAAEPPKCNRRR